MSEAEPQANVPDALAELELPDSADDTGGADNAAEHDIEPELEDEMIRSKDDEIDSDFEPFLEDSDFMRRDGYDLDAVRKFNPDTTRMVLQKSGCTTYSVHVHMLAVVVWHS